MKVAKTCKAPPGWIAFGDPTSYGNELDSRSISLVNFTLVPELVRGARSTTDTTWVLPKPLIPDKVPGVDGEQIITRIQGTAICPTYQPGDYVILDTTAVEPPPSGYFAYWEGNRPAFAFLQTNLSDPGAVDIVRQQQDLTTVSKDDIEIIGRLHGIVFRRPND